MIKNINSGLYMEVDSAKAENGTNVQQWGADTSASHNTWRVLSADDGREQNIQDKISLAAAGMQSSFFRPSGIYGGVSGYPAGGSIRHGSDERQ